MKYLSIQTNVVHGVISLIIVIALAVFLIWRTPKGNATKEITYTGVFAGLGIVLSYIKYPIILPFLSIDLEFTVVIVAYLLFNIRSSLFISMILAIVSYIISGSQVGYPIDQIAMFTAYFSFILALFIFDKVVVEQKQHHLPIKLGIGVFTVTVVMVLMNYLWITPVYIELYTAGGFYSWIGIEEPENFFLWILSTYGIFNLIYYTFNSVVSFVTYKSVNAYLESDSE